MPAGTFVLCVLSYMAHTMAFQIADMFDDAAQRIKALPLAPYGVNVSQLLGGDYNRMYHVR